MNLYNRAGGGSGSINTDDLKEYVQWVNTESVITSEGKTETVDVYADRIRCMTGKEFDDYICQKNCIMFTFNNIGIKLDENGENIWKSHDIKVVDYIVDPPRAFEDILLQPVCDIYVISLDKNRNDFIKEFYSLIKK